VHGSQGRYLRSPYTKVDLGKVPYKVPPTRHLRIRGAGLHRCMFFFRLMVVGLSLCSSRVSGVLPSLFFGFYCFCLRLLPWTVFATCPRALRVCQVLFPLSFLAFLFLPSVVAVGGVCQLPKIILSLAGLFPQVFSFLFPTDGPDSSCKRRRVLREIALGTC